ncbi:MAG TPA: TonB-dependent receptor plug domain-containing protein, partial [Gemmatimonadales bacterium]|nr:TonB-dependent receptor plug domain-containing protein [Gemmatimonadales bacterium]
MRARPSRSIVGLALAAAPLAVPLAAQQPGDSVVLDPIVVTATRVPTPLAATTSAVTVITGAELRERGIGTVAEALRAVPGVDVVETGPFGGATSLF